MPACQCMICFLFLGAALIVLYATLDERIAALQERERERAVVQQGGANHGLPQNGPAPAALRAKIAQFESKGGVPVPRGSFGLGAPPESAPKRRTELYGNRMQPARIPSASLARPTSPFADDADLDDAALFRARAPHPDLHPHPHPQQKPTVQARATAFHTALDIARKAEADVRQERRKSALWLQPQFTGGLTPQHTGGGLTPQHTGGLTPQYTGGLTPQYTGGLTPQYTGGLTPQYTGGSPRLLPQYTGGSSSGAMLSPPLSPLAPYSPGLYSPLRPDGGADDGEGLVDEPEELNTSILEPEDADAIRIPIPDDTPPVQIDAQVDDGELHPAAAPEEQEEEQDVNAVEEEPEPIPIPYDAPPIDAEADGGELDIDADAELHPAPDGDAIDPKGLVSSNHSDPASSEDPASSNHSATTPDARLTALADPDPEYPPSPPAHSDASTLEYPLLDSSHPDPNANALSDPDPASPQDTPDPETAAEDSGELEPDLDSPSPSPDSDPDPDPLPNSLASHAFRAHLSTIAESPRWDARFSVASSMSAGARTRDSVASASSASQSRASGEMRGGNGVEEEGQEQEEEEEARALAGASPYRMSGYTERGYTPSLHSREGSVASREVEDRGSLADREQGDGEGESRASFGGDARKEGERVEEEDAARALARASPYRISST
ncbi:hypothetical protein DFH09DRAFT_1068818 [Mycena vulgaris]|nr:hypothetical protein DFH09DRAFT_1068818 [Mycena vulgaris]